MRCESGSNDCGTQLCARGEASYRASIEAGVIAAEDVPECLLRLGLLQPAEDGPEYLTPVAPSVAADLLLTPLEEEARRLSSQVRTMHETFVLAEELHRRTSQHSRPGLTVLRGHQLIELAIDRAVSACTEELITAQPGSRRPPEILETALAGNLRLLARGVRQRTLYQHAVRSDGPTFDYANQVVAAGGDVRTVDELFDRLIVCDQKVAFIPCGPEYGEEALEVRDPAVVRFLYNVFERVWDRAIPIRASSERRPHEVLTDLERRILRLLVEGYTEDKIARSLSIGRRTVAEHVSRISKRLGSTSRTQLGYLIATNDLVSTHE